jgi:hypothetical protein
MHRAFVPVTFGVGGDITWVAVGMQDEFPCEGAKIPARKFGVDIKAWMSNHPSELS